MPNLAPIKAKASANYTCQECGSTDFIQTHHHIPGDDNSIIVVCGQCHSIKHPDVPRALFLSVRRQYYWFKKPAASLARQWGVHPRTITRAAKRLEILPGDDLIPFDEELIRNNIPKLLWAKLKNDNEEKKKLRERLRIRKGCNWCGHSAADHKSRLRRCPLLMLIYSLYGLALPDSNNS